MPCGQVTAQSVSGWDGSVLPLHCCPDVQFAPFVRVSGLSDPEFPNVATSRLVLAGFYLPGDFGGDDGGSGVSPPTIGPSVRRVIDGGDPGGGGPDDGGNGGPLGTPNGNRVPFNPDIDYM